MPINNNSKSRSYESLYSSASSKNGAKILYQNKSAMRGKKNLQQKQPQQEQSQPQPQCCSASTKTSKLEQESNNFQKRLSARFLRVKSYQNQLTEAQHTINSLVAENRMLRTLHQRQDVALAKYEAANDDLPKLINSHAEEVRVWEVKCCNMKASIKELEERLHKKEALIYALTDQKKYFAHLNKTKQLEERQNLSEQCQVLESQLADIMKNRKQAVWRLEAELKHLKQVLTAEKKKVRNGVFKMEKLRIQLGGFQHLDKTNVSAQQNKTLDFIKEDAELTEASVAEDTDTAVTYSEKNTGFLKNRVLEGRAAMSHVSRRQPNALSSEEGGPQIAADHPSQSTISEDVSSIQSYEEGVAPSGLTEDEKSDADLNSCMSVSSCNAHFTTDGSVTEDERHVLEVVKSTSELKREISDLRGKMNTDFKVREGFLDNFSLLASNNQSTMLTTTAASVVAITDTQNETIPQRSMCTTGPNMHINKLLASLKSMDITNNK